jgi:hypothetical protein
MSWMLRSGLGGVLVTLFLTAVFMATASKVSSIAFWLLFPGVWAVGSVATLFHIQFESGGVNLILGVLAGAIVNIGVYSFLFMAVRSVLNRKVVHRSPNAMPD